MKNLQERLNQCRNDIAVLQEQEKELKQQIEKKEKPKFGDVVKLRGWGAKRIVLYNEIGELVAFSKRGFQVGGLMPHQYLTTGRNIFTNNLLDLDD